VSCAYQRGAAALLLIALAGCGPSYSPNTYNSNAVQQANKVDQGIVIGVRKVDITTQTGIGTVAGGAVGGIAGSQVGQGGVGNAIGALTGTVVGGIVGSTIDAKANETFGYEYIVRKPNKDLMSVTQKDEAPLEIGTHVLLIAGPQARIVRDYTVPIDTDVAEEAKKNPPPVVPPETPAAVPAAAEGATVQPVKAEQLAEPVQTLNPTPAASVAPVETKADAPVPEQPNPADAPKSTAQ
jgi:outer membrane lipoprotein SlyB